MIEGHAHVYGDNVDTDVIIPARYLTSTRVDELALHCMEEIDADFCARVRSGDVMLAGRNFGSGSSREHAPLAIKGSGVACVIAESFARIFFRNAINIGLPIVVCPGAGELAQTGDLVRADLDNGVVENITSGKRLAASPLPPFMQQIIDAGGLMAWVARSLPDRARPAEPTQPAISANEPVQADWRLD